MLSSGKLTYPPPIYFHQVCDFGLFKHSGGTEDVLANATLGAIAHMPPELLSGGLPSKASYAYSFGIMQLEVGCA